jgi:hypothetical protein
VLIILAARQALIVLLVIISPLAFVAYLLPGTEKWFKKWHETFTAMLVFFPAFSLIFGGSQLAGSLIVQNAQSIIMVLFGMAVQIAPLALVPFILKLSTGILGRIAGMVNDPRKGLMDRVKNEAKERQEFYKQRGIGGNLKRGNLLKRGARGLAMNKQNLQRNTERYKQGFEAYANYKTATSKKQQNVELELNIAKVRADNWQNQTKQAVEEFAGGNKNAFHNLQGQKFEMQFDNNGQLVQQPATNPKSMSKSYDAFATDAMRRAVASNQESRVISQAIHSAEHEQQQHFAKNMLNNQVMQERAGGIAEHGADSALASAITAQRKAYGEAVSEAAQIIKHLNLSGTDRQNLALTGEVEVKDPTTGAVIKKFTKDSIYAREAAIEAQLGGEGNYKEIMQIIEASGSSLNYYKTTIGDAIASNKLASKATFLGGQTINQVKQGEIQSPAAMDATVARTIAQGKIKPEHLATMDVDAVRRILTVAAARNPLGQDAAAFNKQIAELGKSAQTALTNPSLSGSVAQNVQPLLDDFVRQWPPPTV